MSEQEKLKIDSNTAPPIDGQSMPSMPATETTCVLDPRGDLFVIASGHGSWGSSNPVRFQVCSRTLARSSSTFERMLYGKFAESKPDGPQEWVVTLPSDPAPAMRQLFEIMHGKFRSLDTKASLTCQLYDLVTVADFYDSVAMLRPLDHPWISNLRDKKENSCNGLLRKAWIFYQLGRLADYEQVATRLVLDVSSVTLRNCQVEQGGNVPLTALPPFLLENVSKLSLQITTRLLEPLYTTATILLEGNTSPLGICIGAPPSYGYHQTQVCDNDKIDCEQRLLGLLLRELHRLCLFPRTKAADVKHSPRVIHSAIRVLAIPREHKASHDVHRNCVLKLDPGNLGTAGKDGRSADLGTFATFKYVANAKEVEFMAR